LLRRNDGDLVMPKLDFQGSEQSRFYRPELGIALQNELRALADIECIYEEQRDGLERSALPPSIKEHLANQLEERRASSREPHEQRLAQLRDEILRVTVYRDQTVH
jgi:hypothetical protein